MYIFLLHRLNVLKRFVVTKKRLCLSACVWVSLAVSDGVVDDRSLEEILSSITPPPPPAMTNEAGAPRLMITHIVNQNFKSYAGEQILGPFHKVSFLF